MTKFEELQASFSDLEVIHDRRPSMQRFSSGQSKQSLDRRALLQRIKSGDQCHNNVLSLTASMVCAGCADGQILELAPELTLEGYSVEQTIKEMTIMIEGAREKKFGQPQRSNADWPTVFVSFDENKIPRRRWLLGNTYLRGYVSLLAAPGGVGKTTLQIVEALSIITGRPLLGEPVREKANVWFINLEDSVEEITRRVLAAMKYHKVPKDQVEGRLFVDADRDLYFQFVNEDGGKPVVDIDLMKQMVRKIEEKKIGLVIIDPFVGSFNVNENDNRAMNMVVSAIRSIADRTDAAIAVVHHMRKLNGEDASIDSVRGAGSVVGAVRVARIVRSISRKEAEENFIDQDTKKRIYRVDNAKMNFAPPAEDTFWYKLESVRLDNGEDIGVARKFDLDEEKPQPDDDQLQEIYQHLKKCGRELRQAEAAKSWIGNEIAQALRMDIGANIASRERTSAQTLCRANIKHQIRELIERGWLTHGEVWSARDSRAVPVYELAQKDY